MTENIKNRIQKYGIVPRKSLGQNFLLDASITDEIAFCSGYLEGKSVLEIGPGPGILTESLLAKGVSKVFAIEQDSRCIELLHDLGLKWNNKLSVLEGDALKLDEQELLTDGKKLKIVANLPYNISTTLIFKWLENISLFESITIMVQKEVALRLAASPRSSSYGRLAVMVQNLCNVDLHFDVPGSAFYPAPKVTSTVVSLIPRDKPICSCSFKQLEKVCKVAFTHRRKTIKHNLKSLFDNPSEVLESLGISQTARAEELNISQFCKLAQIKKCHYQ